jgi:hypothetical protein
MAFQIPTRLDAMVAALVAAHNLRQEEAVASFFHADTTQRTSGEFRLGGVLTVADATVSTANASDTATAVALANALKLAINNHFADTFAHNTAVSAAVSTADATDEATAITLANALKAAYNTHRTASNVHFNNDATNATSATDASDASSLNTLLNEIKTDFNAHIVSAPAGAMIRLQGV